MTIEYQAGVGPNMGTLHIYKRLDERSPVRPSLCQSTNIVRNYRGVLSMSSAKLCRRCFTALQKALPEGDAISAELIGVSAIED